MFLQIQEKWSSPCRKQQEDATGVIGVDLSIASLQKLVESIQIGENGFAVLHG